MGLSCYAVYLKSRGTQRMTTHGLWRYPHQLFRWFLRLLTGSTNGQLIKGNYDWYNIILRIEWHKLSTIKSTKLLSEYKSKEL